MAACTLNLRAYGILLTDQWDAKAAPHEIKCYILIQMPETSANSFVQVKDVLYIYICMFLKLSRALNKCPKDVSLTKETMNIKWLNS